MFENIVTHPYFYAGIVVGIIILFGVIKARWPVVIKILTHRVRKAREFVDKHRTEVPPEFDVVVNHFYELLKEFDDALMDEKLTYQEIYAIGNKFMGFYNHIRTFFWVKT